MVQTWYRPLSLRPCVHTRAHKVREARHPSLPWSQVQGETQKWKEEEEPNQRWRCKEKVGIK